MFRRSASGSLVSRFAAACFLGPLLSVALCSCGETEPEGMKLANLDARDAFLAGADRRNADLSSANLSGAVLDAADLRGANLTGADLWMASVSGTDLRGARGLTREALAGVVYEPRRAPLVDSELASALVQAGDFSIPAVSSEATATLAAAAKVAQATLRVEYIGAPLLTGERGESTTLLRLQMRARAAARCLLHEFAKGDGVELVERLGRESRSGPDEFDDRVVLRVGDRERRVSALSDFGSVSVEAGESSSSGPPKITLLDWSATSVLAWNVRAIARAYKIAWIGSSSEDGGERYRKLVRALEKSELEVGTDVGQGDADLALILDPRQPLDVAALRALRARGRGVLMTIPHDLAAGVEPSVREFLSDVGLEWGKTQVQSGARDPMSGETSFGTDTDKVVVLGEGFSSDALVTRPLRQGESLVEINSVRELRVAAPKAEGVTATQLMSTPPYAWLGTPADLPEEKEKLVSFPFAWLVDDGKAPVIVIAARCFRDEQLHVGNSNLELATRLVGWLTYR